MSQPQPQRNPQGQAPPPNPQFQPQPQQSQPQQGPPQRPQTSEKNRHIHPVIEIVNGYKHFGISRKWNQAMKNVNLAAYKGEIYVLLGPRGSGKTTVTNVILGVCTLNHGDVKIFGFRPGHKLSGVPGLRVGYSPSTDGLFGLLTVNETLRYFGRMLRLKKDYINERLSAVTEMLALPPGKRYIQNCSIMERRQVSFAVAILHEPELIILDEPDNGVDPVTRKFIADHLRTLAQKGCTVFYTSQSLLEAEGADRVGIVRSGYLLMEGSPRELISNNKERNMESLYSHIYSFKVRKNAVVKKKSIEENPMIKIEPLPKYGSDGFLYTGQDEPPPTSHTYKRSFNPCQSFRNFLRILPNFPRIGLLLVRDLLLSFRNFAWICFVLIMPIVILLVLSFTIGTPPNHLKLAIVNLESTEDQCKTDAQKFVSCQVINLIDTKVLETEYKDNYDDAENEARNLKVSGILIVGEKFTNQIMRTMANIDLNNVDIGNPDTSQLILRVDTTSTIVASTIEQAVKKAVEDYLQEATQETKLQNATIGYPLKVGTPLYGRTSTESEYIANGLAIVLLYHLAAFIASFVLVAYRQKQLLTRDYIAGVRLSETVISQLIIYGILLLAEGILMFIILVLIKEKQLEPEFLYLIVIILEQVWCGLCFGILLSSLVRNNVQAGCAVFCFMIISIFLCGVIWPLNGLPEWLMTTVKFLPQTQAIWAARCILQRGIATDTQDFHLAYIIPVVWLVLFILFTILINKIS